MRFFSTRFSATTVLLCMLFSAMPPLGAAAAESPSGFIERTFDAPIDAFSVLLSGLSFEYSYLQSGVWSQTLAYESDGDVGVGDESELVMLPREVTALRVSGIASVKDIHPITVSHEPLRATVASLTFPSGGPRIISRQEWGADESYLVTVPQKSSEVVGGDTAKGDNGAITSSSDQRLKDCLAAQAAYPEEFKADRTVTQNAQGQKLLWPQQHSRSVQLLVVHHTAIKVTGDDRAPVERLRALYKYHALNRGWSDIGYNFAIDEAGTIYEGRAGGSSVVGGHVFCNNVGTIGIVMMGNFEVEKPTQEQAVALQFLLARLASEYRIDLKKPLRFHGKDYPSPVVGHGDVLSTLCPGYSLWNALAQIRTNVLENRLTAGVIFSTPHSYVTPISGSSSSKGTTSTDTSQYTKIADGISFLGRTSITSNPGGKQRISFAYTAGVDGAYEGKKIADVRLSSPAINLWVDDGVDQVPVRSGILLPYDLPAGEALSFQLIVQAPMENGNYTMDIGGIRFTIFSEGRRARTGEYTNPFYTPQSLIVNTQVTPKTSTLNPRVRSQTRRTRSSSSPSSPSSPLTSSPSSHSSLSSPPTSSLPIRIRLSIDSGVALSFPGRGMVSDLPVTPGTEFSLLEKNGECVASLRGVRFTSGPLLRFRSDTSSVLTVKGVKGYTRSYRGVLECRIVDGTLTLINELPLEDYIRGISEEPDSEPYEKQRAFAIAARSYAAHYMNPAYRKFPGKPYDGSDDPAIFQAYAGVEYEAKNPEWVRAANATNGQVLLYNNAILKPAYFSSDDGRTRSPEEIGWKNFPNAAVFSSKPDPWCKGLTLRGHGVGMSGCGALGQAKEGRSAEQILQYYYPGVRLGGL